MNSFEAVVSTSYPYSISSQKKFKSTYSEFLNGLRLDFINSPVLEIGYGTGYLKEYFKELGMKYTGIDSSEDAYSFASTLYGADGYQLGYFPSEFCSVDKKFKTIISFTCLDEVDQKECFVKSVRSFLDKDGVILFAVRNKGFPVNYLKGFSDDLSMREYLELFHQIDLDCVRIEEFPRPIRSGFSVASLKNNLYQFVSRQLGTEMKYMLLFVLRPRS